MSAEKQKTILLVEDEVITAMAEKMALEKFGYTVILANNGEEAVAAVEKTPAIDLVLMDINLGAGIDGTEAAALILRQRDLPVVFLSSHMEPEVVAKTEKITSYGYVVKNTSITVLDGSIKMAFKLFEAKKQEMEKESRMEVALEELRKSEERFRYVLENVRDAVWSADLSGQFEFLSPIMAHIYGRPLAKMMADPAFWISAAHPEDLAMVRASNDALLRDGHVELECRIVLPDGTVRWISDRKILLPDKHGKLSRMAGIISDVTERKRAEESLKINEALFREFYDNMKSGSAIFTVINDGSKGSDYIIKKINSAGLKMEGKTLAEVVGKRFIDIRPTIDSYGLIPVMKKVWETGESAILPTKIYLDERYANYYENYIFKLPSGEVVTLYNDVTENKRMEESLRESEERFRAIVANTPDHIIMHDRDLRYTFVANPQLGFTEVDMLGKTDLDFLELEKGDAENLTAIKNKVLATGEPFHLQTSLKNLSGESEYFDGSFIPKFDSTGKPDGLIGYFRNITERKRVDSQKEAVLAALKESEYLLKEAQKVAHIGHWELDPKIGRPTWSEEIFHIFGLDPKKDEPSFVNHESHLHPDDWPILNMAVTKTSADGSPFDIQFRIVQPGGEIRWMHALGTAIMAANGIVSKLFGTAQDITERRRLEMENQDAQEYAENIVETVREPLVVLNSDLKILKANHGFYETFKLTPGETIGNFIYDLGNRQWDIPKLRMLFEDILPKQTVFNGYEVEHDFPEVGRKIILLNARQIYRKNIGSKIILLATEDITERRRLEMENQDAQEYAENIVETVHEPLMVLDSDLKILTANHSFYDTFNVTPGETIGNFIYDLGNRQWDIPKLRVLFEDILPNNSAFNGYEVEHDFPDIGRKTFLLNARQIFRKNVGSNILLLAMEDITERMQAGSHKETALEALRESEEKLRVLFEQLPIGVSLLGKNRKITYVNPELEKILDISKDDLLQRKYQTRRYIRPDGTTLPPEEYVSERAFKEQKLVRDIEIGVITESGKTIWTNVSAAPFPMVNEGLLIVTADISERKQAEEMLRKSEEFSKRVIESSNDCIKVLDMDGHLLSMSEGGQKLLEIDDITPYLNRSWIDFWKGSDREAALEAISKAKQGIAGKFFGYCETAKGTPKWWEIIISPIKDSHGNIDRLLSISRDITDRKRAEEEIKRQLLEKEFLLKEVHHRIKNNIASIAGLITLRLQSVANPEAVAVLQDAIGRVDSMRILYDKLLLTDDYKDLSVKNYIDSLVDTVVALFTGSATITLEKRIDDFTLDSKRLFPLGIIINELITNKMKYAFIDKKAGTIKISLTHVGHHVTLIIQDNGVGLPDGFDIKESKGFGLMLVKMLSQQLDGSFSMEKHKGTCCTVEFNI